MWNKIKKDQYPRFERLNNELRGIIGGLTDGKTGFFMFDSDDVGTAKGVLKHFADELSPTGKIRKRNTELLQLATEVERLGATPSGVRRTQAGKKIVKDLNRGFCVIL